MRVTMLEMEKIFREIEANRKIKEGTLSEIYKAEARVVFMGKRRNIQPFLRKLVLATLEERK